MKSILDPTFKYIPSTQTDLRKTFARVRREQARAKAAEPVVHIGTLQEFWKTGKVHRGQTK